MPHPKPGAGDDNRLHDPDPMIAGSMNIFLFVSAPFMLLRHYIPVIINQGDIMVFAPPSSPSPPSPPPPETFRVSAITLERIVRLIRNLAHMYSIENSRMGSKVGVAAMLGPANLHILCDFVKFVGFQRNLVDVDYNWSRQRWRSF